MTQINKIFNLGMPRTGNHSLVRALTILGFPSAHDPMSIAVILGNPHITGWTEALRFHPAQLDEAFPRSKFILTVRDMKSWLISCKRYLPRRQLNWNPFWWYDSTRWGDLYNQRIHQVSCCFHDRQWTKLLTIDICDGEGWEQLCPFLGVPIPDVPFPHANKS